MKNYLSNFTQNLTDKKKEILNTVIIFLLLLPNFKLSMFDTNGSFLDTFYNIGRVLCALIVFVYYGLHCIKTKYISKPFFLYAALKLYIFINTWVQVGFSRDSLMTFIAPVVTIFVIDCFAHMHPKELIHALLILFEILVGVNFVFMLIYPIGLPIEGYGAFNHVLGNRNILDTYFILTFTFALLWKEYGGSKLHFYILLPICLVSGFIGKSAAGLICLVLYCVLYFTRLYKSKHITLTGSIVIYVVLFLAFVIFRVQNYMAPLWELLGKNVTFSSRTFIWDSVLEHIPSKIVFGCGEMTLEARIAFFGKAYSHAHNFILEILVEGGLIALAIVGLFFFCTIMQIKDLRDKIQIHYMLLAVIPLMLHAIVEASVGPIDFIIYILLSHGKEIVNYGKPKQIEE